MEPDRVKNDYIMRKSLLPGPSFSWPSSSIHPHIHTAQMQAQGILITRLAQKPWAHEIHVLTTKEGQMQDDKIKHTQS